MRSIDFAKILDLGPHAVLTVPPWQVQGGRWMGNQSSDVSEQLVTRYPQEDSSVVKAGESICFNCSVVSLQSQSGFKSFLQDCYPHFRETAIAMSLQMQTLLGSEVLVLVQNSNFFHLCVCLWRVICQQA